MKGLHDNSGQNEKLTMTRYYGPAFGRFEVGAAREAASKHNERPVILSAAKNLGPNVARRSCAAPRMTSTGALNVLVACLIAASLPTAPQVAHADDSRTTNTTEGIDAELERIAGTIDGVVGVGAIHVESDRAIARNGDVSFPMASTYKVPIAVRLLTLVDQGELSLDDMIDLQPGDLHPGSSMISRLLDDPGVSLSHHNLLELMLLISDNSATDLCLKSAGGGAAVTRQMQDLGIEGLRVDRPTVELIVDWLGLSGLDTGESFRLTDYREQARNLTSEQRSQAAKKFDDDPRDTSTPLASAKLLVAIQLGETLSSESNSLLLDIMHRCETGENRLKGLLPQGTAVAHKTGTIGGTTNDIGIIILPDGAGHVAIAVFVKESTDDVSDRERVIAQIARSVYDYFLFAE